MSARLSAQFSAVLPLMLALLKKPDEEGAAAGEDQLTDDVTCAEE